MAGMKKAGSKKGYRRRPALKRRPRRSVPVAPRDQASLTIVQNSFPMAANTMYTLRNFSLTNNIRATTVAQAYQFYRIKKVKLTWIPYFDTFQPGTSSGYGVPQLYYMIDKSGVIPPSADLNALKKMGAKPHRLDDKNVSCSFAPAVSTGSSDFGSSGPLLGADAGGIRVSPWLPTSMNAGATQDPYKPNSVDHRGINFFVQAQAFNTNQCGELEITIHYEFKKPLWTNAVGVPPTIVDVDTLGEDVPPPVLEVTEVSQVV